jgi:hypothetical protein
MRYTASCEEVFGDYPDINISGDFFSDNGVDFNMVIDGRKYRLIADDYVLEYSEDREEYSTHIFQFNKIEDLNDHLSKLGQWSGKNCSLWKDGIRQNGKAMWQEVKAEYLKNLALRMRANKLACEQKMRAELAQYDYEIANLDKQIDMLVK